MFPTVAFPNPEEPGAIDAALDLAQSVSPDLVIANDPDADRCAVAVPDGPDWRMLRGDELGVLLYAASVERGLPADAVVATSIVSSRQLAALAEASGRRHVETLTGFKWIARVPGLGYGYEEAIGYCVAPDLVRDKDGISAALLIAWYVGVLAERGRTLLDVLDDQAVEVGVYATDAFSVRVRDVSDLGPVLDRLRTSTPPTVGGVPMRRADDLLRWGAGLPPTEGVRWYLEDDSRVVVRPSGTEPKLKVYLEAIVPVPSRPELTVARAEAARRLQRMRADLQALTRV